MCATVPSKNNRNNLAQFSIFFWTVHCGCHVFEVPRADCSRRSLWLCWNSTSQKFVLDRGIVYVIRTESTVSWSHRQGAVVTIILITLHNEWPVHSHAHFISYLNSSLYLAKWFCWPTSTRSFPARALQSSRKNCLRRKTQNSQTSDINSCKIET